MLYLLVFVLFVVTAFVTSTLRYTLHAWRWGMAAAVACAVILIGPALRVLPVLAKAVSLPLGPAAIWTLALLPFGVVLLRLWLQRRNTPRALPGPDDDPVLRRFRAEKLRRRRLERQRQELLENADQSETAM